MIVAHSVGGDYRGMSYLVSDRCAADGYGWLTFPTSDSDRVLASGEAPSLADGVSAARADIDRRVSTPNDSTPTIPQHRGPTEKASK